MIEIERPGYCIECIRKVEVVISIWRGQDDNDPWVALCLPCAEKAVEMLRKAETK